MEVDVFCGYCGTELRPIKEHAFEDTESVAGRYAEQPTERLSSQVKATFLNATERVNAMVGEQGAMNINLRHVFSDVFVKHSKDEGELLFISGTKLTTPAEHEISTTWPKPWLFSRVFLVFLISYIFYT